MYGLSSILVLRQDSNLQLTTGNHTNLSMFFHIKLLSLVFKVSVSQTTVINL